MKIIVLTLLLFLSGIHAAAQQPAVQADVAVMSIFLAKDDGTGRAGDEATSFLTTDIPIYCVVQLNSMTPATVKMNFVAVDVKGVKAETRVFTISYTTNGKQDRVNFTGKPEGNWTAGKYRIDVSLEGKVVDKKEFEIVDAPAKQAETVKSFAPVNAVKPKPRRNPR